MSGDLQSTVNSQDDNSLTSALQKDYSQLTADLSKYYSSETQGKYQKAAAAALMSGIAVYGMAWYLGDNSPQQRALLAAGAGGAACLAGTSAGAQGRLVRTGVGAGLYYFGSMRLDNISNTQLESLVLAALLYVTSPQ